MNYLYLLVLILIILEAFAMSTIEYSANNHNYYYILGIFLYMLVGFLLYKILIYRDLAITNALWNVSSIVLVTFIGVFYFGEKLDNYGKLGILFAILSIVFMEYKNLKKLCSNAIR